MSAGNLIFLLVIAGGAVAMFSMHRGGGHSHGGSRGHDSGHDHASTDTEVSSPPVGEGEKKRLLGKPGARTTEHAAEREGDGHRHRGC